MFLKQFLNQPLDHIKGIARSKKTLLEKLGLFTYEDLLYHCPYRYESSDAHSGSFIVTLSSAFEEKGFGRKKFLKALAYDHIRKSYFTLLFFNSPYVKQVWKTGEYYLCYGGKWTDSYQMPQLVQPKFRILKEEEQESFLQQQLDEVEFPFQAIYPSTEGLTPLIFEKMYQFIFNQLDLALKENWFQEEAFEIFPEGFRPSTLFSRYEAFGLLHLPKRFFKRLKEKAQKEAERTQKPFIASEWTDNRENILKKVQDAKRYFAYEEAFLFLLAFQFLKQKKEVKSIFQAQTTPLILKERQQFLNALPYTLTQGQQKTLEDIYQDMQSPYAMHRLIQGDVGSGKTVLAALASLFTFQHQKQVLYMAPTSVLASQITQTLQSFYREADLPYRVELLLGDFPLKKRKALYQAFEQGHIHLLVGTTALLNESLSKTQVGLVITDEQHRFGVKQRAALQQEERHVHVLSLSATPIPRTLAMILYGDLSLSELRELPAGRPEVKTYTVNSSRLPQVFSLMAEELEKKNQIYVICPLKEQSEEEQGETQERVDRYDIVSMQTLLQEAPALQGKTIAVLHGQMKAKEKDEILKSFIAKEIDILVSTTVIEVGVHHEAANFMLVMNAESFGLSQLHQLRGRIGRTKLKEKEDRRFLCLLHSDMKSDKVHERLKVMCKSRDGFFLAEEDLRLRGPGHFFGLSQHGFPQFVFADLMQMASELKDIKIRVKDFVEKYGEKTLFLRYDEHLQKRFGDFYEKIIL